MAMAVAADDGGKTRFRAEEEENRSKDKRREERKRPARWGRKREAMPPDQVGNTPSNGGHAASCLYACQHVAVMKKG